MSPPAVTYSMNSLAHALAQTAVLNSRSNSAGLIFASICKQEHRVTTDEAEAHTVTSYDVQLQMFHPAADLLRPDRSGIDLRQLEAICQDVKSHRPQLECVGVYRAYRNNDSLLKTTGGARSSISVGSVIQRQAQSLLASPSAFTRALGLPLVLIMLQQDTEVGKVDPVVRVTEQLFACGRPDVSTVTPNTAGSSPFSPVKLRLVSVGATTDLPTNSKNFLLEKSHSKTRKFENFCQSKMMSQAATTSAVGGSGSELLATDETGLRAQVAELEQRAHQMCQLAKRRLQTGYDECRRQHLGGIEHEARRQEQHGQPEWHRIVQQSANRRTKQGQETAREESPLSDKIPAAEYDVSRTEILPELKKEMQQPSAVNGEVGEKTATPDYGQPLGYENSSKQSTAHPFSTNNISLFGYSWHSISDSIANTDRPSASASSSLVATGSASASQSVSSEYRSAVAPDTAAETSFGTADSAGDPGPPPGLEPLNYSNNYGRRSDQPRSDQPRSDQLRSDQPELDRVKPSRSSPANSVEQPAAPTTTAVAATSAVDERTSTMGNNSSACDLPSATLLRSLGLTDDQKAKTTGARLSMGRGGVGRGLKRAQQ